MDESESVRTIQLDNEEFEGHNNSYLLTGDGPTTLLDTGIATDETREKLSAVLARADLTFADIDQVLVTHWHEDHAGLAGTIQEASGCEVAVHPRDAPIVERRDDAMDRLHARQRECLEEWGVPPAKRRELERGIDTDDVTVPPSETTPAPDGTVVAAGDRRLRMVHTPGHSAGHLCFLDEVADIVFSGDALLPVYTPNVGGADVRLDRPLAAYLETLDWFADRMPDRALPGHRAPITDPAGRASEIVTHHARRAGRVLDVVREAGPVNAWTVSQRLFGPVEGVHVIHGPGEAYAHLAHLTAGGILSLTEEGYAANSGAAEALVEQFVSAYGVDPFDG